MSSPERLAYWYLRFNGFLTTENFVVHPDSGSNQRTDADLLAVRFKHRSENLESPMKDDPTVCDVKTYANVIIAEVKTSVCALNGPWTRESDQNIDRVVRAIGCVSQENESAAAGSLYTKGKWANESVTIRLIAFGDQRGQLSPNVPQVLFDEMIGFMWKRIDEYRTQKRSVGSWAEDGRSLMEAFDRCQPAEAEFRKAVRTAFGLSEERQA